MPLLSYKNLYRFAKGIRSIRIENLITGNGCDQILGFAEIDDIVHPARNHMNRFNLVATDFKFLLLFSIQESFDCFYIIFLYKNYFPY